MNNMTKEERFAILWCLNKTMDNYMWDYYDNKGLEKELIVQGISIKKTILDFLEKQNEI